MRFIGEIRLHTFDFVSIGAYTKDTIVTRAGTRQVHGGGYSYSAHAARLLDQRVGAVTRLARQDIESTVEAEFLTGQSDIRVAARKLAAHGPKEIVLTHKDGLLVLANGEYFEQPFRPAQLRGRSGRGDTCVGSYLSSRLQAPPEQSTQWAAALTSLKLEAEGPQRTRACVEELIRRQYS